MPSGVRNFLISFFLSALIFTGVAYYAVQVISMTFHEIETGNSDEASETTPPETTSPDTSAGASSAAPLGTVLNAVLIGTDYQPEIFDDYTVPEDSLEPERRKSADTILFVSFNTRTKRLIVCPIPSQTMVDMDHKNVTLGSSYHDKGPGFICDKVSSLVGQPVSFYAAIRMEKLANVIDYLGGISYEVPCDMKLDKDLGQIHIDLKKGKQQLNGDQVLQMLRYNEYGDTDTRTALAGEFFYSFLKTNANYTNKKNYVALFSALIPSVETNITLADVTNYLSVLFGHTSLTYTPCSYPGAYSDRFFMPNIDSAKQLFDSYNS